MPCGNIQNRFPPERTLQLYRGLVRDAEQKDKNKFFALAQNKRERMRVLEILGLCDKKPRKDILKKTHLVDRPSYLRSNARKRKMLHASRDTPYLKHTQPLPYLSKRKTNKPNHKEIMHTKQAVRIAEDKKEVKKNNYKLNPASNKEYVWHPLKHEKIKENSAMRQDVLRYYRSQFHKKVI